MFPVVTPPFLESYAYRPLVLSDGTPLDSQFFGRFSHAASLNAEGTTLAIGGSATGAFDFFGAHFEVGEDCARIAWLAGVEIPK